MSNLNFEGLVPRDQVGIIPADYGTFAWHDTLVWGATAAHHQHQASIEEVINLGSGHAAAVIASGGGFESDVDFSLRDAVMAIQEPLAAGQTVTLTVTTSDHHTFHVDLTNQARLVNFADLGHIKDATFTLSDPNAHLVLDDIHYRLFPPLGIADPPHFRGMTELNLHDPAAFYEYLATHPGAAPESHPDGWVG
jgi:hypothetical protein